MRPSVRTLWVGLGLAVVAVATQAGVWDILATKAPSKGGSLAADCHGRSLAHLPCILNLNGGILTADAIVVAVIAGLLTLVLTSSQVLAHDADDRRRRARFERLLCEVAYEAAHNLQHLSTAFERQEAFDKKSALKGKPVKPPAFVPVPEIQLIHAPELLSADYEDLWPAVIPADDVTHQRNDLRTVLDHMIRTDDYIRRFPVGRTIPGPVQAQLAFIAQHCMLFMVRAASSGRDHFGERWLKELEVGRNGVMSTADSRRAHLEDTATTALVDLEEQKRQAIEVLHKLKRPMSNPTELLAASFYASWIRGDPAKVADHTLVWYDDRPPPAVARAGPPADQAEATWIVLWPLFRMLRDAPPRIPPLPPRESWLARFLTNPRDALFS